MIPFYVIQNIRLKMHILLRPWKNLAAHYGDHQSPSTKDHDFEEPEMEETYNVDGEERGCEIDKT